MRVNKKLTTCILTACLIMVCLCSCKPSKDTWSNDDFELTVDIPKTTLKVGESMTVSATLKNISGVDAPILDDGVNPLVYVHDVTYTVPLLRSDVGKQGLFVANEAITNKQTVTPDKPGRYIVEINVDFTMRTKNEEKIKIIPDPIYIDVVE